MKKLFLIFLIALGMMLSAGCAVNVTPETSAPVPPEPVTTTEPVPDTTATEATTVPTEPPKPIASRANGSWHCSSDVIESRNLMIYADGRFVQTDNAWGETGDMVSGTYTILSDDGQYQTFLFTTGEETWSAEIWQTELRDDSGTAYPGLVYMTDSGETVYFTGIRWLDPEDDNAYTPTQATTEATTEAPAEPETTQTQPDDSYLQRVPNPAQPIYDGPGYLYEKVGTVAEAGTYTIVEEAADDSGNLWGRLKSGAGWIDLTSVRLPIMADYEENLLAGSEGEYILFTAEESEYLERIAFRANERLTDVSFRLLDVSEVTYGQGQELYAIPELTPDKPFVAGIVFYGDMTTYGISFTDESGRARHFAVYTSGRDGSLILQEYTP